MFDDTRSTIHVQPGKYEQIPHVVLYYPEISANAIRLYLVLHQYARSDRHSWPSRKTLAGKLQVSVSTVDKAKQSLIEIGALCMLHRKTGEDEAWLTNHYHLHEDLSLDCDYFNEARSKYMPPMSNNETTLVENIDYPSLKSNTLNIPSDTHLVKHYSADAEASTAKAAIDVITPNAGHIMADWIDRQGQRPPERVIGQLARETRKLLDEGFAPNQVTAALDSITAKGLHPSTLASELHTMGAGRKKSTAEMCLEIANSP